MRGRIIGAAIRLGVFEVVDTEPKAHNEISDILGIDSEHGYRLFRALTYLGTLNENDEQAFSLTRAGEYLTEDHPQTFKGYFLFETSQMDIRLWLHLPSLIEDGEQNTSTREFGQALFDYLNENPEEATMFNDGMRSYSRLHTDEINELLAIVDIPEQGHACDVGGGHGHLLCSLLSEYPSLTGTVLDQPAVVEEETQHLPMEFDVADRCSYVGGDMFEEVPSANIYLLKHIIHDWNDTQAIQLLSTIREHAPNDARLVLFEHVIPDSQSPHFGTFYDMQMIVWTNGRERTTDEYVELLNQSGWMHINTQFSNNQLLGAVQAVVE